MRLDIRVLLRGQYDDCAVPRGIGRCTVDPSSPSLEETDSAAGLMERGVARRGVAVAKAEVWLRRVGYWSSLGVRLSVRELPDELEVRDGGGWRAVRRGRCWRCVIDMLVLSYKSSGSSIVRGIWRDRLRNGEESVTEYRYSSKIRDAICAT